MMEKDEELLKNIVRKHNPELISTIEKIAIKTLTPKEKEHLQQAVLDEMYEKGLDPNDEPNEYGRELDELIGMIQKI